MENFPKEYYDYKESPLPPEEQEELNNLRRIQFERELNEEERQRFLELSQKEKGNKEEGLSEAEKTEYRQLSREQIDGTDWTPEKAKRIVELQKKLEGRN